MIDFTAYTNEALGAMGTIALRKLARELEMKGMSSSRGEVIRLQIATRRDEQIAASEKERAERTETKTQAAPQGKCTECGRKLKTGEFGGLCGADRTYGEWENAHGDEGHGIEGINADPTVTDECPVCHPELDPRKPKLTGRSRLGMVIVAKGTEIHKSATFRKAAEEAGWTVKVTVEIREVEEDGETFDIERYVANAHRGEDLIKLAWDGRAYDYPTSFAVLAGKTRKVRNLKEALRFL